MEIDLALALDYLGCLLRVQPDEHYRTVGCAQRIVHLLLRPGSLVREDRCDAAGYQVFWPRQGEWFGVIAKEHRLTVVGGPGRDPERGTTATLPRVTHQTTEREDPQSDTENPATQRGRSFDHGSSTDVAAGGGVGQDRTGGKPVDLSGATNMALLHRSLVR